MPDSQPLTTDVLLDRLPHRPPMRLIERVLEIIPGRMARTSRVVLARDWYLDGHFPGKPVVPAVVLVELLAQTGGLAAAPAALDDTSSSTGWRVAALGGFKFPHAAGPGLTLEVTARVAGQVGGLIKIEGEVTAGGRTVAIGSVTLADVSATRA